MKNKKGFTLVELIVSFALITAISLAFFKTILSLQQEQLKNIAKNNYKSFTIVLNNSIQKDFLNDSIKKVISCGDSCYDITYTKNGIVRLSLDKEQNIITYGNIKEKLPKDYKFIGDIEFTSYINDYEGNDSYIALNINVKSNYEKSVENIKYLYQYDSSNEIIELDIDGREASDTIEYLLYSAPEENGLYEPLLPDGTSTGIRYRGENPNNYVYFNCEDTYNDISYGEENYDYQNACEVWRIIGVFDVDNGKGNVEKRVKLVRDEILIWAVWDSSARGEVIENSVNYGYGINQWGPSTYTDGSAYEGADLMRMLNGYYVGEETTCTYCEGENQGECSNDCSSSITPLSDSSLNMLKYATWYTGTPFFAETVSLAKMYQGERSTITGKICTTGDLCNDTVVRTTTWLGKVGLIYASDYGYASMDSLCTANIYGEGSSCNNNNWLYTNQYYWSITHVLHGSKAVYPYRLGGESTVYGYGARRDIGVRPSLYLKSNVTFVGDGNGTEDNPYILNSGH